jgi:hypothetical protein
MLMKVVFNGMIKHHQHKGVRLKSRCWYFIDFLCLSTIIKQTYNIPWLFNLQSSCLCVRIIFNFLDVIISYNKPIYQSSIYSSTPQYCIRLFFNKPLYHVPFFITYCYFLDSVSTFGAVLDMVTDRLFLVPSHSQQQYTCKLKKYVELYCFTVYCLIPMCFELMWFP